MILVSYLLRKSISISDNMNSGSLSTCLSKEQSSTLVLLSILNQATIFKIISISIKKDCMLSKRIGINLYNKFKPLNGQSILFFN